METIDIHALNSLIHLGRAFAIFVFVMIGIYMILAVLKAVMKNRHG